jgi:hypothetical protein
MSEGIIYKTIVLPNDVKAGDVVQIKFDTEGVVYDLFDNSMEECKEEFGYDLYEEIEALNKMSKEKLEIGIYWWIDEDTNEKVYDEDAIREEFEDKLDKLLNQKKDE